MEIIILFAIISFIFKLLSGGQKGGTNSSQRRDPSNRPRPWTEGNAPQRGLPESPIRSLKEQLREVLNEVQEEMKPASIQRKVQVKESKNEVVSKENTKPRPVEAKQVKKLNDKEESFHENDEMQRNLRFDSKAILEGIIMAEVLGPPKSKQGNKIYR